MTHVRRLALRISSWVEQWAAPGCKEWAEAQAREIEFIAGDWAALGWAIGSVRVVLDRRKMPIGSGSKPARPSLLDVIFWLLYLEGCFWGRTKMLTSTDWPRRLGWGLVLLGDLLCLRLAPGEVAASHIGYPGIQALSPRGSGA